MKLHIKIVVLIVSVYIIIGCYGPTDYLSNQEHNNVRSSVSDFPPNSIYKPGWILDRNDEFNDLELDESLWIPSYLSYRTTEERAAANYDLRNGNLVLKIEPHQLTYADDTIMKVSSIQTGIRDYLHKDTLDHHVLTDLKYTPQYGYFEIRAKTVNEDGYHCAFWTTGVRDEPWQEAEIDIMEQHHSNNNSGFNLIPWDDTSISVNTNSLTFPFDPSAGFHTYALEWDANSIKLYVDNVLTKTINQSPQYGAVFYLGIYENAGWTGTADTSGNYPREFIVDYFRAYKKDPLYTATGSGKVEAEDMYLQNYNIGSNPAASNGQFIGVDQDTTGTARYIFNGITGTYSIKTNYFDENDGSSVYNLYINNSLIDTWTANQNLGSDGVESINLTNRVTHSVDINNGDEIRLEGTFNGWEYARLDSIETIVESMIVEAENMTLNNYSIISANDASNYQVISVNQGSTGTATYSFNEYSGNYSIETFFFDENDGFSSYKLFVDNVLIDSWTADQDLGSSGVEESNLTSRLFPSVNLDNGDEIRLEGSFDGWEYARIDKISIVKNQN